MKEEKMEKTLYELLEVDPKADWQSIRLSYRRLVEDSFQIISEVEQRERFELLTKAWQVLCDEEKRAEYDKRLQSI